MRRNLLRERLNAGKPTVGTHILSAWPTLVELIGHSKQYDYVEFTAEYAPFTMHDLDNLGRSFELMNLAGMIKIEQTQYTHQAMRAIGAGFQSVLFADIRSVEDAKVAVDAVRAETTMVRGARGRGRLGVGMRRDVGTVREGGSPAYVDALNEVVIAIMVEKKSCVDDLDRHPVGAGHRHGAVRRLGLLHEHRQDRAVQSSRRAGGRDQDHPDRAEEGHASARRAARSQPGAALSRDGREAFLHRLGRPHPGGLVGHQGRGDAQAPAHQAEEGGGEAGAGAGTRQGARATGAPRRVATTPRSTTAGDNGRCIRQCGQC